MPLTAEELAEFARLVGYAVLQSQALEETLALHLVMVHKADAKAARRDVEKPTTKERRIIGPMKARRKFRNRWITVPPAESRLCQVRCEPYQIFFRTFAYQSGDFRALRLQRRCDFLH
jgi:hypothetical protein